MSDFVGSIKNIGNSLRKTLKRTFTSQEYRYNNIRELSVLSAAEIIEIDPMQINPEILDDKQINVNDHLNNFQKTALHILLNVREKIKKLKGKDKEEQKQHLLLLAKKQFSDIVTRSKKEKLALDPIKDLKSAIGINDKFQFIATLFNGDEKAFEQAIKTINGFKIYAEGQFWIKSNLREQNKWDETAEVVKAFDLLVKRRFA